jgi:hypothetical protein
VLHSCNPAFEKLRQEGQEFEASMGYIDPVSKNSACFNKIGEEGRTGSAWKCGGEGGEQGRAQTMYMHMNKCINN